MRKTSILIFTILFSLIVVSCSNKNSEAFDWLPSVKSKDEILLYDRFDRKIVSYNTKTFSIVQKNDTLNYFQYGFNRLDTNIYTTGHSIENHFKVIQMKDNRIIELLSMKPSEDIFPVAVKDESKAFFTVSVYDEKGAEIKGKRTIYSLDVEKKQLSKFSGTEGFVTSSGVYYNGYLYFTAYIAKDHSHNLYRLDDSNFQNSPQLMLTKLGAPEIYVSQNQLWLSNRNSIYCGKKKFPKKSLNYFYKEKLIQIGINSSADKVLYVTDVRSGKEEEAIERFVDFKIEGDNMMVYAYDGTHSIKLN